jgi:tRNA-modifying protein YgfZ
MVEKDHVHVEPHGGMAVADAGIPEMSPVQQTALQRGALVFDRSDRRRIVVSGAKADEMIAGLVTSDVVGLSPGHGQYSVALTAKGKIVADLRIFRVQDGLLIDASPRAGTPWLEIVRKYVNPRVAPHRDVSAEMAEIGVFGGDALRIVGRALGSTEELDALDSYAHRTIGWGDRQVMVARVPELSAPGVDLFLPADAKEELVEALKGLGALEGAAATWEIARVEAGRPEWGVDMDDSTLAQEANMDELGAISYTKGCYLGQETVARVHFRGHVNRHLRRLRFACSDLPPAGAHLLNDEGKDVGVVTSVVRSLRLGGIGMGMVRREVPDGVTVRVQWERSECGARVSALNSPAE